ncbi:hypothetical protein LXL04_038215 [Taraxacum kok-saghyz]
MNLSLAPTKFGNSTLLINSIPVGKFQWRPLADHSAVKNGRPPEALTIPRELFDASTVAEAISVISCWYEDKTECGQRIGWIYGSVTEDVVTGYRMHNRGWKSVSTSSSAPVGYRLRRNFFSCNNALLASSRMKILQRAASLNVATYPFTSIFLIIYCFLPALSLFSGQFIVQTLIGGTSAHLAAVLQGLRKVVAGIEISFTLTSKSGGEDEDDEFADLYTVKWTSLMIPPITIMMVNLIAIAVGFIRTIYSTIPQWSRLLGGVFFSFLGVGTSVPICERVDGKKRKNTDHCVCVVWTYCNHHFTSVGRL